MNQHNTKKNSSKCKNDVCSLRECLPGLREHLIFWPIVILGATADLLSKTAVFKWLQNEPNWQHSVIDGFFKFVIRENSGAAFSIAQGKTTMLVTVSIAALVVVVGLFLFSRCRQKLFQIGLALFTAGIIGNLYDRMFNHGYVRDFIDIYYGNYHWPVFNIADSMLCVAVGVLLIANLRATSSQKPAQKQKEEHPSQP